MAGALLWAVIPASAASLTLTTTAPTPGTNDVYNFEGGENDDANIASGADQNTYIAPDRPTQGQILTTPTGSAGGYVLSDIWIRHCGYTTAASSGNGTWYNLAAGAVYTLRVTDPSKNGQVGFVLSSETYTATGTEDAGVRWIGGGGLGDANWLHFTLATPLVLAAGTQYGVDLTATTAAGGNYFEWLGNKTNVFASGTAYTGTTAGTPGNTVNLVTGDRVFLVQLGHFVPPVPPVLTSPLRFVPAGQSLQVTATIPSIANTDQSATLVLTNNNPSLISLPGGAGTLTLNFAAGATNVQTFNVQVLANGVGSLSVVTNASFTDASTWIGTPIVAQEEFEYDPTTQPLLDLANGGSGFGAAWSQTTAFDTIVAGLTYRTNPSVVTSSNAVSVSANGNEAFRPLLGTFGGAGGGTVYISFLVQASAGLFDWGGLSFFNGTTSENLFMGEVVASSPNNTWGFSQGGNFNMNFTGSVTPGAQVDFLVYRIDFPTTNGGSGNTLVSIYVNPPLNNTEPYTPTGSAYVNSFTFDHIRLGTGDTLTFDEIRIGTQWTNVVPFVGTPDPLPPPTPTLSVPALFVPLGQDTTVTAVIPTNSPRPLIMVITNDNPTAFSLSSTNASLLTLTFGVGATNVQTFNVHPLAAGSANLTVISNATVNTTTLSIASQVSASESFEYEAGTDNLAGNTGGFGFAVNAWTLGGSVISPGLTYSGLLSSSNAANVTASGSGNGLRTLYLSSTNNYGGVGGGTVWISFLIQGAFPGTPQYADVGLLNGAAESFFMGLTTTEPNNGKWGYRGLGAGFTTFDNSVTPSTNTDLLVYRLDFPATSGGLINVTFYADPPAGLTPPSTPTGTGSAYSFTFNGIQIATSFNMNFDEIRVGGSWAEVVPLIASLGITQISGNQVQISWPTSVAGTYTLLSSTNVLGPWNNAGLTVSTSGGNYVVTDTISGNAKFYRLLKQ
jgi:hypothetical protein